MDANRVVSVVSADGRGSGYVIAPRLVITSAHVSGPVGTAVTVFAVEEGRRSSGTVTWRGTAGGRDDAALVEVDAPGWMQRQDRAAETAQPSGTLNPGGRYVGDRYVMTVTGAPPGPTGDGSSPWGGLSGAAYPAV